MDIAIIWDPAHFRGDWGVTSGDLTTDSPLRSAVLVSFFTDRVASPDYKPTDGTNDRRGWWGDSYEPSPIGSRLWQLNRREISNRAQFIAEAEDMCREALQWLLDDGVASAVTVSASLPQPTRLHIEVAATRPGGDPQTFAFSWAWKGL